jgi:hypothetical protein
MGIKAAMLDAGLSNLVFHALRENGNSACSSGLLVVWNGELAKNIHVKLRCKSKACQKLFAQADKESTHAQHS